LAAGVALGGLPTCTELARSAQAQTSATIKPAFTPDRLNAKGALTLTIDYSGGEAAVPSPVRRLVMMLPAGLGLDIPTLRSCGATRLLVRGASGCPAQSKIGSGRALIEADAGSQLITESLTLSLFLGPLQGFQATFEVLGQGYTPLLKRIVLRGTVIPGRSPYGEELVMSIPPIPTVPLEPDASVAELTLTVGASAHRLAGDANTIVVPPACPAGGFPFAAETTYADGFTGSSLATASCPR
jgi:hypothetical protein